MKAQQLKCSRCNRMLDETHFAKARIDRKKYRNRGFSYWCRECASHYYRQRKENWKTRFLCSKCGKVNITHSTYLLCPSCRWASAERATALKLATFDTYGGLKCACCGETRIEFLSIDHIAGGGNKHRREITGTCGTRFYGWLKKNNYPEGYQVLCMNCNFAKGHFGSCPHIKEYREDWNTDFGIAV